MTDHWLVCHKQTINLMLMCNVFMLIYSLIHCLLCQLFCSCEVCYFNYILLELQTTQNVLWSCASVCVCLCVRGRTPTLLHGPGCNLGAWQRLPPSCTLLGRFAIGTRVALLWQHNANPSYKLASIPRYDDIVRTAVWAGSARANAKCQRVHALYSLCTQYCTGIRDIANFCWKSQFFLHMCIWHPSWEVGVSHWNFAQIFSMETRLSCHVVCVILYVQPFWQNSILCQNDRRTDGRTDRQTQATVYAALQHSMPSRGRNGPMSRLKSIRSRY